MPQRVCATRSPPLVLTRPTEQITSAELQTMCSNGRIIAPDLAGLGCDWRWTPEGALARGEETGNAPRNFRAPDLPGSDRRVLKRPEEPTPVAESPISPGLLALRW